MLRKFTLGLIGAVMIALPATDALAQGQPCQESGRSGACVSPQGQGGGQGGGQGAQAAHGTQKKAGGTETAAGKPVSKAAAPAQAAAKPNQMQKGQKLASGGDRLSDPKAYGLKEEPGASYYRKDGQLYRVDDQTHEILAVIGAVADLLN